MPITVWKWQRDSSRIARDSWSPQLLQLQYPLEMTHFLFTGLKLHHYRCIQGVQLEVDAAILRFPFSQFSPSGAYISTRPSCNQVSYWPTGLCLPHQLDSQDARVCVCVSVCVCVCVGWIYCLSHCHFLPYLLLMSWISFLCMCQGFHCYSVYLSFLLLYLTVTVERDGGGGGKDSVYTLCTIHYRENPEHHCYTN